MTITLIKTEYMSQEDERQVISGCLLIALNQTQRYMWL